MEPLHSSVTPVHTAVAPAHTHMPGIETYDFVPEYVHGLSHIHKKYPNPRNPEHQYVIHHEADLYTMSSSEDEMNSSASWESFSSNDYNLDRDSLTHLNQQSDSLKPKDFPQIDTTKYRPVTIPSQKY